MELPAAADVAARTRAALAYADIQVKDAEAKVGISYATMARIVSAKNPRGAHTVEELWRIADGCGVPRSFMERGFAGDRVPLDEEAVAARLADVERKLELLTQRAVTEPVDLVPPTSAPHRPPGAAPSETSGTPSAPREARGSQ